MRTVAPIGAVGLAAVFGAAIIGGLGAPPVIAVGLGVVLVVGGLATRVPLRLLPWVATCMLVLTIQWNGLRIAGGAFGNAFMVSAFVLTCAHALLTKRPIRMPAPLMVVGVTWLAVSMLCLIFPPSYHLLNLTDINIYNLAVQTGQALDISHRSDLFTLVQVLLSILVIPLVVMYASSTRARLITLMDLWTAGAVASAAVGLLQTLGLANLSPSRLNDGTRSAGLTIHPNYLALGACLAIPTAMLWIGRSTRWTLAGVTSLFILLGGVYASGSRMGAVTAVVALVATAVVNPVLRQRALQAAPVVGMVMVVVLVYTKLGSHLLHQVRLGGGGGTDVSIAGSNSQRSIDAHIAWKQFTGRPVVGVGFSVIEDAHSIYLQLLSAGGIIGTAAFLVFLGGLADAVRRALGGLLRHEAAACGIAVAAWLVSGVVDNQLGDKYLYVIPGFIFAIAHLTREQEVAEPPPHPAPVAEPALAPAPVPAFAP